MTKKYELTDDIKCLDNNITLHRIKALRDFGNVKAGDLGGYIESEGNLSQNGDSWVGDYAMVYGDAVVYDSAMVYGDARVYGNARVYDYARVCDHAKVHDTAYISDFCEIYGYANVCGDAWIMDNAHIYGCAEVSGDVWVKDNAEVWEDAIVTGSTSIGGKAIIRGDTKLIAGSILGTGYVFSDHDHCGFDGFGRENRHTHAYRTRDNSIEITCGCFTGTIDEFEAAVHKTHAGSRYEKEYMTIIEVIKIKFRLD